MNPLLATSPIDGRYHSKTQEYQTIFSEFGLIKNRLSIEVNYFIQLAQTQAIAELPALTTEQTALLTQVVEQFDIEQCQQIKTIEQRTNHDVKAVEYYLKQQFGNIPNLSKYSEFIHFALTSEDVNNLSHALMLKQGRTVIVQQIETLLKSLKKLVTNTANIAMLGHTHGQPATPTTVGKELANYYQRIALQLKAIDNVAIKGKCNGAIGCYNAHLISYPTVDWVAFSKAFINKLGLEFNPITTQIEPHDYIAELNFHLSQLATIVIDLDRDIWSYIAKGYFKQKVVAGEVGSSTMPHKVNPIDFENSEGNARLANSMLITLAQTLPISRLQRDLTDSTLLRNLGVGFGYLSIALLSTDKGLNKLEVNEKQIASDLNANWEVLTEAIQTVMRKNNIANPYEKLKQLSRGQRLTKADVQGFIETLELPASDKQRLLALLPATYIGLAEKLALQTINNDAI